MTNTSRSLDFHFPGTHREVRRALVRVRQYLLQDCENKDAAGKAEIVLAEILNNIVEHALPDIPEGAINLNCRAVEGGWAFGVSDNGHPMPGGKIPGPGLPDIDTTLEDLPEGGFGWALVHMLATDIAYQRIAGRNCLTFCLLSD